jgi:hypothetical protein
MKLSLVTLSLLAGAGAMARPSKDTRDVQTAHLTFHGGPASYELAVPADGTEIQTSASILFRILKTITSSWREPADSDIAISIIDAPDYNAQTQCKFKTDGEQTLVQSIDTTTGAQHVILGPPQPIRSVSCLGSCVPTYSDCYINGQPVGPCCNVSSSSYFFLLDHIGWWWVLMPGRVSVLRTSAVPGTLERTELEMDDEGEREIYHDPYDLNCSRCRSGQRLAHVISHSFDNPVFNHVVHVVVSCLFVREE